MTNKKYSALSKDIEQLKNIRDKIEEVEFNDEALITYYATFYPSELIDIAIDFMEDGNITHGDHT